MLKRDTNNGMMFGVCSGLSNHLDVPVEIVRLVTVLSFFFTGSITFWIYLFAAVLLPKD